MPNNSGLEIIRPGAIPAALGTTEGAGGALMNPENINPDAIVAGAKKVAEVIDRLTAYGLSLTEPRHWVAYKEGGGKSSPWLTAHGAELLVTRLSLQVKYLDEGFDMVAFDDEIRGDDGSVTTVRQYMITVKLRVSLGTWASIACEGHTTTKDPFFSRGGRLHGAEVDMGNIRQAAYSNALANGVTRLLGIRNLGWDDVARITGGGVTADNVDGASFKRGARGGKGQGKPDRKASKEQVTAVWQRWVAVMRYDPKALPDDVQAQFGQWAADTLRRLPAKDYSTWTEKDLHVLQPRLDAMRDAAPPPLDEPPPPAEAQGPDEPPPPGDDEAPPVD